MTLRRIEKILVPIALTREGEIAIEQAIKFQKVFGSRIIIMNIIPAKNGIRIFTGKEAQKRAVERAKLKLNDFLENYFAGEIPGFVSAEVRSGGLIPSIIQASKDFATQLIIIKKSKRLVGRFAAFRRHNAEKLIGQSLCPILTISQDFTPSVIKEIVMPVDISKKTDAKMRWAVFIAKAFSAKVTIISVLNINIEKRTSLTYRKAVAMEEQLQAEGIDSRVLLINETSGKQADIFLRNADNVNPDMIMIMTHEETMLLGEYIGKFAREVIHRAQPPVFNVVPKTGTLFDV